MSLLKSCFLLLCLLALALAEDPADPDFQNELEEELEVECPRGYGLFRVKSEYDVTNNEKPMRRRYNSHPDRRWLWQCRKIDIWRKDYCTWIEGINTLEEAMFFQCDSDAFMAGVRSVYDIDAEDRVWDVKCCRLLGICMEHCSLITSPDLLVPSTNPLDYTADDCSVFTGIFSNYINNDGDRQYRLEECEVGKCGHYKYKK